MATDRTMRTAETNMGLYLWEVLIDGMKIVMPNSLLTEETVA